LQRLDVVLVLWDAAVLCETMCISRRTWTWTAVCGRWDTAKCYWHHY